MEGDWFTIAFQYERLPIFYFFCELIGHFELKCEKLFDAYKDCSEFAYQ